MLTITQGSLESIKRHAQKESPKEACGILAGKKNKTGLMVTAVYFCKNIDENPGQAYTIEPNELLTLVDEIERSKSLKLIGFYHSHPYSSPSPSRIDVERATWDGFIYLIYSMTEKNLRCFMWQESEQRFVEENYTVL